MKPLDRVATELDSRPAPSPYDRELELGDVLVEYLESIGVEYVFGIPGGAIEPLMDALARAERRGGPRAIIARHEAGSAFMADGYTRETGRLGVCFATTGPGATNLVTGVANASENRIPMLVLTAQTRLETFGRQGFQESSGLGLDTVQMMQSITRYNSLISHPQQLERKLASAILAAFRAPQGPVHLSLPPDVLRAAPQPAAPVYDLPRLLRRRSAYDSSAIRHLYSELTHARKVVIVIGPEAHDAADRILEFAEVIEAAVVTTPHGKGLVSDYHPLNFGIFGFAGHRSARRVLTDPEVDMILAVGTQFGEWSSANWSEALLNDRLVHMDSVEEHFSSSPMARLHIKGDIVASFAHLLMFAEEDMRSGMVTRSRTRNWQRPATQPQAADLPSCELNEPARCTDGSSPIRPEHLMHLLPRIFPADTRYLADTGNSLAWSLHYLHPPDAAVADQFTRARMPGHSPPADRLPGRAAPLSLYRASIEFAPMGWAIGGAIGTALGSPHTPVVCLTGDGSVLMNGQEITVARELGLSVIYIVLNDGGYGMVKHGQRLSGAERAGYELPRVDFAQLAHALGARGLTIRSGRELAALDSGELLGQGVPTLLDIHIDPEAVPPMQLRVEAITHRSENP